MLAIKKNLREECCLSGPHKDGTRVMLCPACGSTYSAHRGDYWDTPENHKFTCCDGVVMELVIPYSGYKPIR